MWLKTFFSDLYSLIKSIYRLIIAEVALILAARIVLTTSDSAVATGGKPPFIASAVSYVSYGVLILTFAVMIIRAVIYLRSKIYGTASVNEVRKGTISVAAEITSACLCVFVFSLAGYFLFVLGYILLSAGGSYFDFIFHSLLPPLGYSAADFGIPMILYTLLTVSLLLLALTLSLAFSFVFSCTKKQRGRFAVGFMLGFYAVSLTLFIVLILSNIPPAENFAGYMYSGNYANVISAYLAAAIAAVVPAVSAFPFAIFYAAKKL